MSDGSPRGRRRILILFSDTGGGHRASARAIESALLALDGEIQVRHLDPLLAEGPRLVRRAASLYSPIIRHSRHSWGVIYHVGNFRPAYAAIRSTLTGTVRRVIQQAIVDFDPDLVISVHPLLNHAAHGAIRRVARSRPAGSRRRPLLMVTVTDLLRFHRGWAEPRADLIVVPTEAAFRLCVELGVSSDRLQLHGLPVDLSFRPAAEGEPAALRRRLGLEEDRFTVLITGGGEGSGKLYDQVRALEGVSRPIQLIVVCGRNRAAQQRLQKARLRVQARVFGFVNNMADLMRASDLVITKAGPGAIAETLACSLPMIITSYLPGQESPNVAFVTSSGFGLYAPRLDQLRQAVESLAAPPRAELARMTAVARKMSRPDASIKIARAALDLLGAPAPRETGASV